MATFDRLSVYQRFLSTGLVPLFFHADPEVARCVVAACIEGGTGIVEMTNRGEGASGVFTGLVQEFKKSNPDLILGVGSILDAPTAALYIAAGANFIVAPNFNPEVARLCNRRKIPYIPGCSTPSEISTAEEAGAEIVKIFPADPELIKAVLGPMPWSRLMPAGGVEVSQESVQRWIKAGACALGVGSQLITKQALASQNYDAVREGVHNMLGWLQSARANQ